MIGVETVLASVAIGMAASLAAMIWPFHRGTVGVVVNLVVGAAGAVAGALFGYFVLPSGQNEPTYTLLVFPAIGALAALGIAHLGWARWAKPHSRS